MLCGWNSSLLTRAEQAATSLAAHSCAADADARAALAAERLAEVLGRAAAALPAADPLRRQRSWFKKCSGC